MKNAVLITVLLFLSSISLTQTSIAEDVINEMMAPLNNDGVEGLIEQLGRARAEYLQEWASSENKVLLVVVLEVKQALFKAENWKNYQVQIVQSLRASDRWQPKASIVISSRRDLEVGYRYVAFLNDHAFDASSDLHVVWMGGRPSNIFIWPIDSPEARFVKTLFKKRGHKKRAKKGDTKKGDTHVSPFPYYLERVNHTTKLEENNDN